MHKAGWQAARLRKPLSRQSWSSVSWLSLSNALTGPPSLEETAVFQVILDDDVCDSIEYKLDVVGVCRTCEVCVYFFGVFLFVQVLKLKLDVGSSFFISVGSCELWEADGEW